jgi:pimeloyl-ACP methyl ester carboxylesterase
VIAGMAPRIVYLHGFASGPGSKKAQFFRRRFAQRSVQVDVPDLAAGGFERLSISGQLAVVEAAARGEAACLMGSSLGGYLAALYAARHPETTHLVLMAPAFGFARRYLDSLGPLEEERWRRTGWRSVFNYASGREQRLGWQLMEDALGYEDYPAVPQPALIFHGLRDEQVPCALSEEFARRNAHTRLELVDDGHELLGSVDRIWTAAAEFLGVRDCDAAP